MADDDINVGVVIGVAVGSGFSSFLAAGAGSWWALKAYQEGRLSRRWWRLRVGGLGGVRTLDQALGYDCALCCLSLDQREEVRTLSCDHIFHFRSGAKCGNTIDDWLRENRMRCPVCCKIAYPVLPWKAPRTSPPPPPARSPSTTDLEAQAQLPQPSSDLETQVSQPSAREVGPRAPPRPPPMPSSPWFKDTLRSRSPSQSPSEPPSQ